MIFSNYQNKISKKIFPFCPGIVWPIRNGKYILPKIDLNKFSSKTSDKILTVICNGDLFESFFSFSILEAYNIFFPKIHLQWSGNQLFNELLKLNGIAKFIEFDFNKLDEFTTPLFVDMNSNYYLNILRNYRNVKTYYNYFGYHCKKPASFQIFSNSFISWKNLFIPKIRLPIREKITSNKKIVLIFPDKTKFSNKNISCFDDNINFNTLSVILSKMNYDLILLTNNTSNYYGTYFNIYDLSIENIFYFIQKADIILSKDIDFLLLAILFSKKIIYKFPLQKREIREFIPDTNYHFLHGKYPTKSELVYIDNFTIKSIYENI